MSRIHDMLASLKQAGQEPRAIMVRVCAGQPAQGTLARVIEGLELGGVGLAEIVLPAPLMWGVPESIAMAASKSLAQGVTVARALDEIAAVRERCSLGIVLCASAWCVFEGGGPAEFMERVAGIGVDGLWLPDVPLEEITPFRESAKSQGLDITLAITPTTSVERAERIAAACSGMVRLHAPSPQDAAPRVARLREMTNLPVACECGADDPPRVGELARFADIVATDGLIARLESAQARNQDLCAVASDVAGELTRAMRR